MSKIVKSSFLILTSISCIAFASCGGKSYSTYQCPMKCQGDTTYTKAGQCPVCKMDLEGIEKKK